MGLWCELTRTKEPLMSDAATPEKAGGNSRVAFLEFIEAYEDIDQAVAEAVGMRKDLRARIKGAGLNLTAFDRARKESNKSAEKRTEEDRAYRAMMAWLGKPIGTQANLFAELEPVERVEPLARSEPPLPLDLQQAITQEAPKPEQAARPDDSAMRFSEAQIQRVFDHGQQAGLSGLARANNPWNTGTYLCQRWDEGWLDGQHLLLINGPGKSSASANGEEHAKRGRGRPPGSRNRPKDEADEAPPPDDAAA
jgi:hypothetical protein